MTNDKDELAKLLGEMAEGEHAEEDHAHTDHDDPIAHVTEAPSPPAAQPPPKPSPTPIAKSLPPTPPRPAVKPPPKPSTPIAKPIIPPAPAATPPRPPVKPAPPPRPAPVVKPQPQSPPPKSKPLFTPSAQAPLPTPIPTPPPASTPIIADEEEPQRYSGTDDDAVIVPALAPTDFIPKPRPVLPPRQHLSQKLFFKRTIIPILLTLGLICLIIPALGLLSSQFSPFKALAEIYFLATFWPLGLAFVVFGLLTMFSVKKQLEPPTPPES